MAGIAQVIEFFRELVDGSNVDNVKGDPGGGGIKTYQHAGDAGDDSQPLPGDRLISVAEAGTGREAAIAYVDPINKGIAAGGEKRIYGRDPSTGVVNSSVHLKANGDIVSSNAGGSMTLKPDGTLTVDTTQAVILNAPDVRIGNLAGQAVARVGDLVAVNVPFLLTTTPGLAVTPVPPTAVTSTGYAATGKIISGSPNVKAS